MNIDSIDLFLVALPLRQAMTTPAGEFDRLHTVVARLRSGDHVGWGESAPGNAPLANEEWAGGVFETAARWLAPAIQGNEIGTGDDLHQRWAALKGNRYAKALLDTAWWDLHAREEGQPLHRMLGGKRDALEVGVTFDRMETIDELLDAIRSAIMAGFTRICLKFRPGWDVQMLNFVRQEFPVETIHIDCEAGLRSEHTDILYRLDDFSLAMVEQPLPPDDLVAHAMIQESLRTPLCLDEGINTLEQADIALDLKSCQYVKIELGRVGGFTPAMAIHDFCRGKSIPCWVGTTPQSSLGLRLAAALATKDNFTYPTEYLNPGEFLAADLVPPLLAAADPNDQKQKITLGAAPGVGVEPSLEVLEQFAVRKLSLP